MKVVNLLRYGSARADESDPFSAPERMLGSRDFAARESSTRQQVDAANNRLRNCRIVRVLECGDELLAAPTEGADFERLSMCYDACGDWPVFERNSFGGLIDTGRRVPAYRVRNDWNDLDSFDKCS